MTAILYVGQQVADDLAGTVEENLQRYRDGDFSDLEQAGNWRVGLSVRADLSKLEGLLPDAGVASEIANSMLVGSVFKELTPTLAREDRVWLRLSHVEALEYSRQRWLKPESSDEVLARDVKKHFFAGGLTACRDDHAVSRLWWNHHIASKVLPGEPERALESILARADIRSSLIERPGIGARPALARAIVYMLEDSSNGLRTGELLFRQFMKQVNLQGAGVVFEVWSEQKIRDFMLRCLDSARRKQPTSSEPADFTALALL